MRNLLIHIIEFYRKHISVLKCKPTCRFYPTCSQYAIDALKTHGTFIGLALSIWRILRCNPFCRGGVDKVPPKIVFGKKK